MKKTLVISSALMSALMFAACNKVENEIPQQPEVKKAILTANIAPDTKTYLDGVSVKWTASDQLAVFSNTDFNLTQYDLIDGANTNHGVFYGSEKTGDRFLAVYPYSRVTKISDGYCLVSIPLTQQYEEGGFKSNYLPMHASGVSMENMSFNYDGGIMRIKLFSSTPTTVSKITVQFAGFGSNHINDVRLDINGTRSTDGGANGYYTYTLNCPDVELGADDEHATEFNIVYTGGFVATNGFSMTITASTGKMYITKASSFNAQYGKIISYNPKEFVPAAIDESKQASLDGENWSTLETFSGTPTTALYVRTTDPSSPLTAPDLAVIKTILGRASTAIALDMSASQYISTTWPAFESQIRLGSILLPSNIKILDARAFNSCTYLASIDLSNIQEIKVRAFDGTRIPRLDLPAGLVTLPATGYIAYDDPYLTQFVVDAENPNFCSVDGVLYTKNMKKLLEYPKGKADTSYEVPEGVTTIASYGLANALNITSLPLPSTLSSFSLNPYSNWKNITQLTWNRAEPGTVSSADPSYKTVPQLMCTGGNLTVPSECEAAYFTSWAWLNTNGWKVNGKTYAEVIVP